MSKVKRILSVIMAMVMVLAMSVPTFAAEKSATITVTGLDKDATVTYKQIIEPDVTTVTGWKFTDATDAKAFTGKDDEVTAEEQQNIIWKLLKMKSGSTQMTNEPAGVVAYTAQEFATAIGKITTSTPVTDENGQPKKAGETGEISWSVSKAGIYVVNAASDYKTGDKVKYTYSSMAGYISFGTYDSTTGVPENLVSTGIVAKSSSIDITKENNESDKVVEVGKVVEYTVRTKIPYVNDANPITTFEVTDTITGAEYVKNDAGKLVLKVTVGTGAETDVQVDVNNNSFTLDLTSYLAKNDHANQSVVIKYSAKVTGTVVNNTVQWDDGNNKSESATDTLYTGTVTLTKTGENSAKLEKAEFVLVRKEKDTTKYAVAAKTEDKAEYTVRSWVADQKVATTMITDANGNIVVKGLDDSTDEMTYEFKETKAPDGYSINATNAEVKWDKEGAGKVAATRAGAASMTDTKLNTLPSTGGIGTTIFTIGGCAIMIVAAGLFFATRRKTQK